MSNAAKLMKVLEGASHHVIGETMQLAALIIAPTFPVFPAELTQIQRLEWIVSQLTEGELCPTSALVRQF